MVGGRSSRGLRLGRYVARGAHPKAHDWLMNYVVKKSAAFRKSFPAWLAYADPAVASAGWASTTERGRVDVVPDVITNGWVRPSYREAAAVRRC